MMKIKPTDENLREWINIYVPEKDLFFLSKDIVSEIDLSNVLLMPIEEFRDYNTFQDINYVNSYTYWNIKNVEYVIIAEKNWIESITKEERKLILTSQIQCGRGLVIPVAFIDKIEHIPHRYIINENIVIQRSMWELLEDEVKMKLLNKMVYEWWDNGDCETPPECLPNFLKPFANTFSNRQGANCLSAVLFSVSKGKPNWIIYEWVYQKTFIETLKRYNYEVHIGEDIQKDDVLVWQDENSVIQHAAYHIGNNLYFNKDGQTIFNPWKIIKEDQLYKDWGHLTPIKYRRAI